MSDQSPPGRPPDFDSPTVRGAGQGDSPMLADKYRVDRVIGQGSFGRVYLAMDPRVRRNVAVKELLAARNRTDGDAYARSLERFQREARAAGVTQHQNIVTVYELAVDKRENYYLVMEYVDGTDLRALLMQVGTLPAERAIALALDIARALEAIHEQDIVHRDLKPANIMLTRRGAAKLTDFGVAQVGTESQRSTTAGGHPGTPLYMSPEQGNSVGYLDGRSDLYSLGLVLYEMLTGTPYARTRRPLETVRPDLPPPLRAIVACLLAPNADDRYPTATDLVRELENLSAARQGLGIPETIPPDAASNVPTYIAGPGSRGPDGSGGAAGAGSVYGTVPPAPSGFPPTYGAGAAGIAGASGYGTPPLQGGSPPPFMPPNPPPPYGGGGYGYGNQPAPFAPPPPAALQRNGNSGSRGLLIVGGLLAVVVAVVIGVFALRGGSGGTATATPPAVNGTVAAYDATSTALATGPFTPAAAAASIPATPAVSPAPVDSPSPAVTPSIVPTATRAASPSPAATPSPVPTATRAATSAPAPAAMLATWNDAGGRVRVQYPGNWKLVPNPQEANDDLILQLSGPDGVYFNIYAYTTNQTLVQDLNDFRTNTLNCADASSFCSAVTDVKVGGEAAKYFEAGNPTMSGGATEYAYWLVDARGVRYEFELERPGTRKAEGKAIVDSVAFTAPVATRATSTVPPRPTSAPTTAWTDMSGTLRFRYPTAWTQKPDTINGNEAVTLSAVGVRVIVFVNPRPTGTPDDQLKTVRDDLGSDKTLGYTFDPPRDARVGGDPARSQGFAFKNQAGDRATGTTWVVDHAGKRYTFVCADLSTHRAEIEALIASVVFLK